MQDYVYSKIENTPRPTLFAACGLVLLAAIGLWVSLLAELTLSDAGATLASIVYYLPFVVLPVALYMRRRPGLSDAMRLNPLPVGPIFAIALLALMSVYAASALTAAWGWGLDALGLHAALGAPLPETRRELVLSIITLAAVPAVCEELLFRAFVLSAWESRGTWYAIGMTSVLFALLHGNLYGLPAYLLVGAVAGFVTFALNSVYAGIVYHTIYNAACLVIPWLLTGEGDAELVVNARLVLSLALEALTILSMMAMLLAALRLRARRAGIEPIPRIRRPLAGRERAMLTAALATMAATIAIVLVLTARAAAG